MVTDGLPTARTQREEHGSSLRSDGNYTTTHANKTINTLQQPEKDHTRTVGYYDPTTMIPDHHAFSPKLSARAVAVLGGPRRRYQMILLCEIAKQYEAH